MEELICPYPGLRPFNEEEAIFFKGRDEHIEQITRQLEEKKFLMLTGASGDGKSSLVYAGLIPNARAGFFKAKFNNWIVVDFRPERTPLKNLADALSDKFGEAEKERFQNELKFGFSALIDIYTQSPFYIDKNSPSYLALDESEKKKAIRKGANLMILVDQFEEFFTNKENYTQGIASVDSQTVVNLILETSKIALEKDIPIYCVCTMRSDYIGQCASFRGLPEAIGFSQFFVPRLKRKEIYQVIQEPALLNGNKITKRLTEVLISEMDEGIDQLPVLQHALNQIWQMADKGKEEMDLIHFAKIGGIKKNYLTKEDEANFENWFSSLPEYKKKFYANPSLDNVLDAHANDLFYRAYDYFKTKNREINLSEEEAFSIINTTFKCLTKIDQSRGVRNRMTLAEIVHIIDNKKIGEKEVAGILEIFRLQGNTFLKPFYSEGTKLSTDTVLDITHESLIRNWNNLITWAEEENADYLIWLDFEKQLQRWLKDDKSTGYLLPIGPLNFFETWIEKKNPNKYWLLKYDDRDLPYETKLKEADDLLKNAKEFIKKSSRKLFVSKTILKYGAKRVAYVISAIMVVISCWYLYGDYNYKTNENVLARGEEKGLELIKSPKVKASTKAQFMLLYENSHPGSIVDNLQKCGNDSLQLKTALEIFSLLGYQYNEIDFEKDGYLNDLPIEIRNEVTGIKLEIIGYFKDYYLKQLKSGDEKINDYLAGRLFALANLMEYGSPMDSVNSAKFKPHMNQTDDILFSKYINPLVVNKSKITNIRLFNLIIYHLMGHDYNRKNLESVLNGITPFNSENMEYFSQNFPLKEKLYIGNDLQLDHNGAYELLAGLYAYFDQEDRVVLLVDSLLKYDSGFPSRPGFGPDHIADCHWLGSKDENHRLIFNLARWKSELGFGYLNFLEVYSHNIKYGNRYWYDTELFYSKNNYLNPNLFYYSEKNKRKEMIDWQFRRIDDSEISENERHFLKSNLFKSMAIEAFRNGDSLKGSRWMTEFKNELFKIEKSYLDDSIAVNTDVYNTTTGISRKLMLLYPKYVDPYHGGNLWFDNESSTDNVMYYLTDWKIFKEFGFNEKELEFFLNCVLNDFKSLPLRFDNMFKRKNRYEEKREFLIAISESIKNNELGDELFEMKLSLPTRLFDSDTGIRSNTNIEREFLLKKEYFEGKKEIVEAKLIILESYLFNLIRNGQLERAMKFFDFIQDPLIKNNLKLDLCNYCLKYGIEEDAVTILHSYIKEFNPNKSVPALFFKIVGHLGGAELMNYANNLLKESNESNKPVLLRYLIKGMVLRSEFYTAMSIVPNNISSDSELQYINEMLSADFIHNSDEKTRKEKYWLTQLYNWEDPIYETNSIKTTVTTE